MKLDKLLPFLKCPYCCNINLISEKDFLLCSECKTNFSVIEGVPVLIKEENFSEQENKQKAWYEEHYSKFSREEYQLENWRLSMIERIFSAVKNSAIKTYLDIGCGATGYTAIEGAKRNKWLSFGADISTEAILRAKNLAKKQGVEDLTGFVVCSAESLPFKDATFDFVSAISLLEHLENDEKVIKEVFGILKKKGSFYVCLPNTYRRMWPFLWPIYLYFDIQVGHKRHYSIEELSNKMAKNDFKLKDFFYNAHLKKLLQIILDKFRLLGEKNWWQIEKQDIGKNPMGIQLNAIFTKQIINERYNRQALS